ncbi:MAG: LEA type 2 family protein [Gemmatimonadota bacterium]
MFPTSAFPSATRPGLIFSPSHARRSLLNQFILGSLLLLMVACTALGGWLYEDPTFVLSELTVRGKNPIDTLELVLTGCNRNDFPVEATGIDVQFVMEGSDLGSTQSTVAFMLQTRDSTKLTVPLVLPPELADSGVRLSYVMTGHSMLNTPIGARRVEIYQKGRVSLMPRDVVAHITAAGRPCRPGQSTLPGYLAPPILIDPRHVQPGSSEP